MDNQIRGLQQANRNVQQGNNLLQTAEGGLNEIGNILGRMRELAVQSASDTVSGSDRDSIDLEFDQLGAEITRIAKSTEYNGMKLLDGSFNDTDGEGITIQIGADNSTNDRLQVNFGDFRLTVTSGYDNTDFGGTAADLTSGVHDVDLAAKVTADAFGLTDGGHAQDTITTLDSMIESVNDARADIGAKQNRLEFTSSNLLNSIQNNSASMSTIRDADFAAEAADLAKNQILVQSGTSMLAQANSLSQNVLALIR
jgi:flagellin